MKLNLKCGKNIKKGYLNIDVIDHENVPIDLYKKGDYLNLDWICADLSIEEILSDDSINQTELNNIPNVLKNWYSKLSPGSTLYIQVLDIYTITKLFQLNQISTDELNQILFNNKTISIIDKDTIFDILRKCGFRIETFSYDGIYLDIWAIKND